MAKREQRIKNATRVDMNCNPIFSVPEWRKSNPDAEYFDSKFECFTYHELKNFGVEVLIKPIKISLIPGYDTWKFDFPKYIKSEKTQQLKILKQKAEESIASPAQRKKLITKWKGELTKEFNNLYSKELVPERSIAATWEPDFLLPRYRTFLECKGGQGNDAWRNTLKLGRYKAFKAGYNVVVTHTQKEVKAFISHLLDKGMKDPRENIINERSLDERLDEILTKIYYGRTSN